MLAADLPDPLDLIPSPDEIHRRICEATYTRRVLRQLLRISMAVHRDREAAAKAAREGDNPARATVGAGNAPR